MNATASRSSATSSSTSDSIADLRFAGQLRGVEKLKEFLFEEKVLIQPDQLESLDLGPLNNLKYDAAGRSPSEAEWRALDKTLSGLVPLLTPELRWKLRIKELEFFFRKMPLIALGIAVSALFFYVLFPQFFGNSLSTWGWNTYYFISLIVWTISQGVLGACAFLGVSVVTARTAKQNTASDPLALAIDITDQNILTIRIILGAMFAFIIGLPLSYKGIDTIVKNLFPASGIQSQPPSSAQLKDYVFLLAPFMFGFSTSLVLGIFSRIVKSINTLLGISSETQ